MKKVLLVDDDALIVEVYRERFLQEGFHVEVARDGLEAMKVLPSVKPDVAVLDIMMPKFSGADVLKFIRSRPDLKTIWVIILSNFYMSDLTEQTAARGADRALLKSKCTPAILLDIVNELLTGKPATQPAPEVTVGVPSSPRPASAETSPAAVQPQKEVAKQKVDAESQAKMRADFLKNAPATLATIRQLCHAFVRSTEPQARALRLDDFYRKIHFVTAMSGLAGCERIALLASAFEAFLFELHEKPKFISPSTLQTVAHTIDFLGVLFERAHVATREMPLTAQALVVDDDPLSSRTMLAALQRAHLQGRSFAEPVAALRHLHENHYDLFLLDIEMRGMSGFQLCERIRALPDHKNTPVIFVTGHSDFENRARGVLAGGNDLISKPVFPIELAVKAVTQLLKARLAGQSAPR